MKKLYYISWNGTCARFTRCFDSKVERDKEADNRKRLDGSIYIANELYTPAEAKRYNLNMDYVDAVEVSKRCVYWCFGARFEAANG